MNKSNYATVFASLSLLTADPQANNEISNQNCCSSGPVCSTWPWHRNSQSSARLPGNLAEVTRDMPVHIFKEFQWACSKCKRQYDREIKWALKPTCGIFTNHTKQGSFWLFLCGSSSRSQSTATELALRSWLASKHWSRILKPQTFVHLAKKRHTHAQEHPTRPQESPLSKYSRQLPSFQTHPPKHSVPSNQGEMSQT